MATQMGDMEATRVEDAPRSGARATLIYDGDCPLCRRYVAYVRVRRAAGGLKLIDARKGGRDVDAARARGFDLDAGMVLRLGGRYFHGADCVNRLALMSSRSDWFNRLNFLLFQSPRLSSFCYPALRAGRNLLLALLGRSKLDR